MAWSDDFVIDIKGIKRRSECLVEWFDKTSLLPGESKIYYKEVSIKSCDRKELFEETQREQMAGPMSCHRLYLDSQFVQAARSRALRVITSLPEKFDIARLRSSD